MSLPFLGRDVPVTACTSPESNEIHFGDKFPFVKADCTEPMFHRSPSLLAIVIRDTPHMDTADIGRYALIFVLDALLTLRAYYPFVALAKNN